MEEPTAVEQSSDSLIVQPERRILSASEVRLLYYVEARPLPPDRRFLGPDDIEWLAVHGDRR